MLSSWQLLFICFISTAKPGFVRKGDSFPQSGWADKVGFELSANLLASIKPKAFQKSKATVSEQVLLSTISVRLKIHLTRDNLRPSMASYSQPLVLK